MVNVSRAVAVRFPFGAALGDPGNGALQKAVLGFALDVLEKGGFSGIVDVPYKWRQKDF